MFRWIPHVKSATHDRDSTPAGFQRPPVGGTIDPPGQTADYRPTGCGQGTPIGVGQPDAVGGCLTGTHHRYSPIRRKGAAHKKEIWSAGKIYQMVWISGFALRHYGNPEGRQLDSSLRRIDHDRPASPFRYLHPTTANPLQNGSHSPVSGQQLVTPIWMHPRIRQAQEVVGVHHSFRNPSASAAWVSPTAWAPSRSAVVRATLRTRS